LNVSSAKGDKMRFLDILRKLGILRFGTKTGTYHNAKEMPDEFLMDDVYNAEKDLTHLSDFKRKKKDKKSGT